MEISTMVTWFFTLPFEEVFHVKIVGERANSLTI